VEHLTEFFSVICIGKYGSVPIILFNSVKLDYSFLYYVEKVKSEGMRNRKLKSKNIVKSRSHRAELLILSPEVLIANSVCSMK